MIEVAYVIGLLSSNILAFWFGRVYERYKNTKRSINLSDLARLLVRSGLMHSEQFKCEHEAAEVLFAQMNKFLKGDAL